jgi:MtN3 and saliva related transmembrane protein
MEQGSDPKKKIAKYYEKYMLGMGILGQSLFYVQALKIFISCSAKDVSLLGFTLGLISVSSWLVYGIMIKNKVLIVSNAVAVVGAFLVILGVLIHG